MRKLGITRAVVLAPDRIEDDLAVVDANAVPRELCSPDEKKIRAFIASKKAEGYKADEISVAGLRISATVQVQSR